MTVMNSETMALELQTVNNSMKSHSAQDVLAYALDRFDGQIVLACSFGAEDVVLVDMIQRINNGTPLFFLDTDFLFTETYELKDKIIDRYKLSPDQVIQMKSELTPEQQVREFGEALWLRDPNQCCQLRKVEPLTRVLKRYAAWITGIRREQSADRAEAPFLEWDQRFGLVKINPLVKWTSADVWEYIKLHDVPYNPLHDQNYPSIGCTHCTGPVNPGEDPRSGRWRNSSKTECGLHKKDENNETQ